MLRNKFEDKTTATGAAALASKTNVDRMMDAVQNNCSNISN